MSTTTAGVTNEPELPPLTQNVTAYPEGTVLRSVCPDCLEVAGRLADGTYCIRCLVAHGRWVRVVWGRGGAI